MLAITEAQSDISFDAMVERQRKVAEIIRKDPAVLYVNSTVGVGGPNSSAQQRPHVGRAQAQARARRARARSFSACGRRPSQVTGMNVFFQMIQNINVGGRINKSQYQYTLQSSDTEALYKLAPELRDKIAKVDGLLDVDDRSLRQQSAGDDRGRSREGGGLRHHHRPGPPGVVQRLRQPPGRDHLHAEQRLSGDPGNQAGIPGAIRRACRTSSSRPTAAARSLRPSGTAAGPGTGITGNGIPSGASIPLSAVTKPVPSVGPLLVNHQGQQPSVTISFNLAPGFALGDAVTAIQRHRTRFQSAGDDLDRLPGHGAGVPGFAEGPGHPDPRGDLRRLRGARHSLRELHPSDHHHFRPAVGGHRRAADADPVQHGSVGDRHDRHRHAGRHRQEERHHDGGLRA